MLNRNNCYPKQEMAHTYYQQLVTTLIAQFDPHKGKYFILRPSFHELDGQAAEIRLQLHADKGFFSASDVKMYYASASWDFPIGELGFTAWEILHAFGTVSLRINKHNPAAPKKPIYFFWGGDLPLDLSPWFVWNSNLGIWKSRVFPATAIPGQFPGKYRNLFKEWGLNVLLQALQEDFDVGKQQAVEMLRKMSYVPSKK